MADSGTSSGTDREMNIGAEQSEGTGQSPAEGHGKDIPGGAAGGEAGDILMETEAKWQEKLKKLVKAIINAADEKKAEDIIAVHVSDKTLIADWFIFMSGSSAIHVKTLCDELEDRAAELGLAVKRREGYHEGRWIVMDFSSILVHIFHPEEREYYNVERLWIDPATEILKPEDAGD